MTRFRGNSAAIDTRPYTTYVYVILRLGSDVVIYKWKKKKKEQTGKKILWKERLSMRGGLLSEMELLDGDPSQ